MHRDIKPENLLLFNSVDVRTALLSGRAGSGSGLPVRALAPTRFSCTFNVSAWDA